MELQLSNQYKITPFIKGDEVLLAKHLSNTEVLKWLLDIPHPYLIETAKNWITNNLEFYNKNFRHVNFVIRDKNNQLIGGIGAKFMQGSNFAHSCEIGYWLAQPFWGKGIASLAVKKFSDYLIEKERLVRVTACPFTTNLASARVLDKSGFKLEGILNKFVVKNQAYLDCYLYAKVK